MPTNYFAAALGEVIAVQQTESGIPCVAKIGTQSNVACSILADPSNSIIIDGGESEQGPQRIMVVKALLTSFTREPQGQPPINTTKVVINGVTKYVLSVEEVNGILYIDIGFPDGEE